MGDSRVFGAIDQKCDVRICPADMWEISESFFAPPKMIGASLGSRAAARPGEHLEYPTSPEPVSLFGYGMLGRQGGEYCRGKR